MAPNASVRDSIALRRVEVATCFLRGLPRVKIAERLGVSVGTIQRDLSAIRKKWLESRSLDYDLAQEVELRKIDYLEREAWEAWDRSQLPTQTSKISGSGEELKETRRGEKTSRSQFGASKFLEIIARCIDRRCAILGIPVTRADHPIVVQTVDIRQALLMDDQFLEYCRHCAIHGDPRQLCVLDLPAAVADVSPPDAAGPGIDGPGAG
jgi:hypothetical protein